MPYLSKLEGGGLTPGQSVVVKGVMQEGDAGCADSEQEEAKADGAIERQVRHQPDGGAGGGGRDGAPPQRPPRGGQVGPQLPSQRPVVPLQHCPLLPRVVEGAGGQLREKEEREKLHLKAGEEFTVRIRCHDNQFEIFFNQKELCTFDYRSALSGINHLGITGAIQLHGVNWSPCPRSTSAPVGERGGSCRGGKYYPVPYEAAITGGFTPGKKLYVSGVPEDKGVKRFPHSSTSLPERTSDDPRLPLEVQRQHQGRPGEHHLPLQPALL